MFRSGIWRTYPWRLNPAAGEITRPNSEGGPANPPRLAASGYGATT